jgi:phycobilisome core component
MIATSLKLGSTLRGKLSVKSYNGECPANCCGPVLSSLLTKSVYRDYWEKNFMRDAVTSLIRNYDITGRYLDRNAIDSLKDYFDTGMRRVQAATIINSNSSAIVKQAGLRLFDELPELIRPGGNAYTTRRYAACLRDMDYYLRYATYALVAGDTDVLDERVLEGLRETYNSLGVPCGPTVRGIQIMKEIVKDQVTTATGVEKTDFLDQPFDYMSRELGEKDI